MTARVNERPARPRPVTCFTTVHVWGEPVGIIIGAPANWLAQTTRGDPIGTYKTQREARRAIVERYAADACR
jgi:hypothetical protein